MPPLVRHLLPLLSLLGLLGLAAAQAQTLALRSDLWCPYACEPAAREQGYLVELVGAALPQVRIDYRIGRWSELRRERSRPPQPVLLLLGLSLTADNERDFLLVRLAVIQAQTCAYRRAVPGLAEWRLRSPADVRGLRLGLTQGCFYHPEIDALLAEPATRRFITQVGSERASLAHAHMLSLGRVDVVLEERSVMQWALRQPGVAGDIVEAGCLAQQPIDTMYLALPRSDARAAALADSLQQGLLRLQQSGEMQRLRQRYGLTP